MKRFTFFFYLGLAQCATGGAALGEKTLVLERFEAKTVPAPTNGPAQKAALEALGWKGGNIEDAKLDHYLIKEGDNTFVRSHYLKDTEAKSIFKELTETIEWDVSKLPYLRWKWRARVPPPKAKITDSTVSDAPAQVYVLWRYFPRYYVLKYFWSVSEPVGTSFKQGNPVMGQLMGHIMRMGPPWNEWHTETRNVAEDFQKAFNRKPPGNVRGIALLSDADETKSVSEADYDDFEALSSPNP